MKTITLNAAGEQAYSLPVNAALSFDPFIEYLKKRAEGEPTVKADFFKKVLEKFESYQQNGAALTLENISQYEPLLEYIYACNTSPVADEQQLAWGLSFPFQPHIFYGTELLFTLLTQKDEKYEATQTEEDYRRERLQLVYSFILKRLYNFQSPVKTGLYHAGTSTTTGLLEYYSVNINTDFISVTAKGELPALDCNRLYMHLSEGASYEIMENMLPLDMFEFRGMAMLTVTDITPYKAVDNIRKVRLNRKPGADSSAQDTVIRSLKTLVRNSKIEFDLFPFVHINDEPVYGFEKTGTGILFSVWGEKTLSPEDFRDQAKSYTANPSFFFSQDIFQEEVKKEYKFLDDFRKLGVRSLALMPIFLERTPVGVLGVHTWGDDTFNEKTLALLEPAIGAIGQLLQVYRDEFNLEIENIVMEKFTSLQPAVQWKFNEAAWQYLQQRKKQLPAKVQNVHFNDVYPLYGAIDIRNSTIERNKAVRADLDNHLRILCEMLTKVQHEHPSSLLEEALFNCTKWQQVLEQEEWNATDETNLNHFLTEGTLPYLKHLAQQEPTTRNDIEGYLKLLHGSGEAVQHNRNALEASMQMINNAINNYFETEKDKLQQAYPCYFEKFRTDGIEYDIYIGQSISPNRVFDHFHLKNLRLWQLSSMAAITRLTRSLLPNMPQQLRTTQLIFAHNHTIDISFRADERRFDVEGTYNIRYQMIKKRIDKVHIRNTDERLTQTDKIALIYFNRKDIEDYLPYLQYMQETGVLQNDLEELELEDLQGLSGLKALRVGVA